MITFHEAEFDMFDGYHFNSGWNNKINIVMNNLYDLRLKFRNGKSPAQVVINLLMNSMHGKTICKPVETDTTIKDSRDDSEKYMSLNYICNDNGLEVNGL